MLARIRAQKESGFAVCEQSHSCYVYIKWLYVLGKIGEGNRSERAREGEKEFVVKRNDVTTTDLNQLWHSPIK